MGKTNDYTAIGPLTGFIYQIYYFLYRLLTMRDGETVSLEKIDDVGAEEGDRQTYYQLKHSINSKPPELKRMANRDPDLWKTLNMWVNIIKKKGDEKAQRQWIEQSEFVLVSNKDAENNKLLELIEAYKKDDEKWGDLEEYLSDQAAKEPKEKSEETDKKNINTYTKTVDGYRLKKELLKKVTVEFESDEELVQKIDKEIQFSKYVPEKRVSDMRYLLKGALDEAILRKEAEYDNVSFTAKFGPLFNDMRTRKFIPLNRKVTLPENLMGQTFVKQLQDVDAPKSNDRKTVITLTEQKLRFENDYRASNKASGARAQRRFEEDMHTEWKNIFDDKNDGLTFMSDEQTKRKAGKEVLKEAKKIHLKYEQEDIGATASNGCLYHFSDGDNPQIGWRIDWESLYNGREWTTD